MPIKCLSIPKRRLEVPTKIGAIMGIDRRSFLTASTTALHWIAMLILAGMISEGAMAQR
jgi:hypothetical protein